MPGWPAKERMEAAVGHGQAGAVIEIAYVQMKGPVFFDINQVLLNQIHVTRLTIWGQAHDFVLGRVDFETGVISKGRIQESKGVRKANLFLNRQLIAATGKG